MLWRVRTTLPDKPGTLAALAQRCGEAGANILGLQIFPGLDDVTDEIVLSTADDWTPEQVTQLVTSAGGADVVTQPSTEAALDDQPTRYVQAARTVLDRPMAFPEVVAQLFDAEAEPTDPSVVHDTMEMTVGDVQVQVHRTAPFTDTERARGAAMAGLVNDVLGRAPQAVPVVTGARRAGTDATPEYVAGADSVTAYVDGAVVGSARLGEPSVHDGTTVRPADLAVDPGWQRRGIGTRLLLDISRIASASGADEVLLTTAADNEAVLPMVLGAGLRGRIRMAADELTVRVPVGGLKPLAR
jgi:ribosomal protein S18 acetylase RimI-like enzyme